MVVTLLEVSEREREREKGCSGLTPTHWAFKNSLCWSRYQKEGNVLFNDTLNTF